MRFWEKNTKKINDLTPPKKTEVQNRRYVLYPFLNTKEFARKRGLQEKRERSKTLQHAHKLLREKISDDLTVVCVMREKDCSGYEQENELKLPNLNEWVVVADSMMEHTIFDEYGSENTFDDWVLVEIENQMNLEKC